MTKTEYGFKSDIPLSLEATIKKVSQYLVDTGFEVYPNLDSSRTIDILSAEKSNRRKVLSVFNPFLLDSNSENDNIVFASSRIIIKELDIGNTQVFIYDPMKTVAIGDDNKDIQDIAGKAQARLAAALFKLSIDFSKREHFI